MSQSMQGKGQKCGRVGKASGPVICEDGSKNQQQAQPDENQPMEDSLM